MVLYTQEVKTVIIFYRALFYRSIKTRLAVSIGTQKALSCQVCMLEYIDREIKLHDASIVHAIDEEAASGQCFWKPDIIQRGSTLSLRLRNALSDVFTHRRGKIALIGSDIPLLEKRDLEDAFSALDTANIYMLPSTDGGFGLIAMNGNYFDILTDDITNSLEYCTIAEKAKAARLTLCTGRTIDDIDTVEDMQSFLSMKEKNYNQEILARSLQKVLKKQKL